MKRLLFVLISVNLLISRFGVAQDVPLFASDSLLELRITMDVRTVIKERDKQKRLPHKAVLSYLMPTGDTVKHKIKISVRGNNRANICTFPPLKLDFKKNKVAGTLFAGQNKLKLVTHCNYTRDAEEYLLREYYVYKLYQLVSPYSFKVRLCKVVYADTEGKFKPEPHYAFIIEDYKRMASRFDMVKFKADIKNQELCSRKELDRLMFFQYLIGNLDWSVPYQHNIKLIAPEGGTMPIAIPYDFDYAGMVNKPDAQPPLNIDIPSVRVRVFRGLCRLDGGYDEAINYFKEIKPEVYALYRNAQYLSEKSRNYSLKYLDGFYKIIEDPKQVKSRIYKACWADHKHLFDYK